MPSSIKKAAASARVPNTPDLDQLAQPGLRVLRYFHCQHIVVFSGNCPLNRAANVPADG